jgi:hypothetical protein
MRLFGTSLALLSFSAVSSAQFLRASSYASVSTSSGNNFQTNEQNWVSASVGATLTRTANATVGGGSSQTTFISGFGILKGSTRASLNTSGIGFASSQGLFSAFSSFIGASFYDTITLTGVGVVSLTINYSLHSVNTDPNGETFAQTELKMATFSTALGNSSPGAISHTGAGNRTDSGSITVTGFAGQKFDLTGDLASLSSVNYTASSSGSISAESDAMHTGSIWINPTSGGFTAASGSSYLAPVPEPMSLLVLGLGSGILLRRRSRK